MEGANPFLGVIFHLIGGLASASFYIPYRGVKKWSWETYWLTGGFFSWIIAPWVAAVILVPNLWAVLTGVEPSVLLWAYLFGAMWGAGGLTFGLTMRYLGVSLGMAVALGYCTVFGTLMPPLFAGTLDDTAATVSGVAIIFGLLMCVQGIVATGLAGMSKEKELPEEVKKETIAEFSFTKGILVATFSGIMSAGMSYGIAAGEPIKELVKLEANELWSGLPVLCVVLLGGFTTNFIWCMGLAIKNRSLGDYIDTKTPLIRNYVFSAIAGTTWYLQFFFYTMGESKIGAYKFSSWALHMASIIVFSTCWGLVLKEWKGSSWRTFALLFLGLLVLVNAMLILGYGNFLEDYIKGLVGAK